MWQLRLENNSKWFPQQCQIYGRSLTTFICFVCYVSLYLLRCHTFFLWSIVHIYTYHWLRLSIHFFSSCCSSSPLYWLHLIECLWWHLPSFLLTSTWLQWWIDAMRTNDNTTLGLKEHPTGNGFKLVVVNQKGLKGTTTIPWWWWQASNHGKHLVMVNQKGFKGTSTTRWWWWQHLTMTNTTSDWDYNNGGAIPATKYSRGLLE